jgi:HPt (histidine-containing phosphotransfer) domain-containing protein
MEAITAIREIEKVTGAHVPVVSAASPAVQDDVLNRSLKLLEVIQTAIRAGDVDTIRHTTEALKGSITSLLAREALNAAATLEKAEHEDDLDRAQDACRRLRAAIASLNPQ